MTGRRAAVLRVAVASPPSSIPIATSTAAWRSSPPGSPTAVARRRADDPDPSDRFRGLYISDAQVDGLLGGQPVAVPPGQPIRSLSRRVRSARGRADAAEAAGARSRLRRLAARASSWTALDVELLLVALAPDLDPRFERLYGYLHDDVSRRRASVGLALELCGRPAASPEGRTPGTGAAGRASTPPRRWSPGGLVLSRTPSGRS